MKKQILLLFICLLSVIGMQAQSILMKNLEWLQGTWVSGQKDSTVIYEQWNFANDTTLFGGNFKVKNGDSTLMQYARINLGKNIFFGYTKPSENGGQEVQFPAVVNKANEMHYQNPQREMPQSFHYYKVSEDSMYCVVTGVKNGQKRDLTFGFHKIESMVYGMRRYYFVMVNKGPKFDQEMSVVEKLQIAHINKVNEWSRMGKLLSGGPFEDESGDWKEILIFNCATESQVKKLLNTDPIFLNGRYTYTIKGWLTQ